VGVINRLWSIESTFTNTGAMADHRLPLRSELGLPFAMALDAALGGGAAPTSEFLKEAKIAEYLRVLVSELKGNHGKAVVVAGRRQSPAVHALVARINQSIGAVGNTLDYLADPDGDRPSHLASISQLAADMAAGKVQSLVMLGGNPVYDAPADCDFAAALGKVATSVHLAEYQNETSLKSSWHVPRAHFLEAWGDVRTWDGTVSIGQPIIAPLYGGLAVSELLSMLLGDEQTSEQLVRGTHESLVGNWRQNVHDGFVANTQLAPAQVAIGALPQTQLSPTQQGGTLLKNGDLEVTFHYSSFSYDGRFANNAWLQETPDFLTKVTWDNYALVGPHTATALGLENDTMITVTVDGRKIELPCYTMPGQAKFSIALVLGGGRTAAGRVGGNGDKHRVGWDTYKVRTKATFDLATKASAQGGGAKYELASIQEHWDIRAGLGVANSGYIFRDDGDVNAKGLNDRLPKMRPDGSDEHPDSLIKVITQDILNTTRSGRPRRTRGSSTTSRTPATTTAPARAATRCSRRRTTTATAGRWRSTSPRARVATRAWSPASRRTTCPSSAARRSATTARCPGSASTGTSAARPRIRRSCTSPSAASTASRRRARRSARSARRRTPTRA